MSMPLRSATLRDLVASVPVAAHPLEAGAGPHAEAAWTGGLTLAAATAVLVMLAAALLAYPMPIRLRRTARVRAAPVSGGGRMPDDRPGSSGAPAGRNGPAPTSAPIRRAAVGAAVVTGTAALVGADWWLAALLGAAAAVAIRRSARPPRLGEDDLLALAAACDLLATCVATGLTTVAALEAVLVGQASGAAAPNDRPGVGAHGAARRHAFAALAAAAALLRLGAEPARAWMPVRAVPALAELAAAAERSAIGGVRLADAARRHARLLRERRRDAVAASAARAGVAMTAPLALCFLPAFLCLGLAPVILGLLEQTRLW